MRKSVYRIDKMDCPSEENLIRMKLKGFGNISQLDFSLEARKLEVLHNEDTSIITDAIEELGLNSKLESDEETAGIIIPETDRSTQKKYLLAVLIINAAFFLIEGAAGIIYKSMGLSADALDMLADAVVYGLSLYVINKSITAQKRTAKISGYFQASLAAIGIIETIRRVFGFEGLPNYSSMIIVSLFALLGNAASLIILNRSKSREAHIKASVIFTANDIIINIGVITAGVLVLLTGSKYPDLIAGIIIFTIVINGSRKIFALAK